jgi:hypothetical protein
VTVGTWLLDFFGAVHGGVWERAAGYTPAALVAEFQHGLVRLDAVSIAAVLILTGLALAAVWMRIGVASRRRAYESAGILALAAAAILGCTLVRASWDVSESRSNSFSRADERALRQVRAPLEIEVHLAPEDPRRIDLERRALSKLRRTLPHVHVTYVSATSIGLFEQTSAGYGEIRYRLGDRKTMSRVTTEEGVLETIYGLAGVTPPKEDETPVFRGHPLAVEPRGAGAIFFGIWPGLVVAGAILARRSLR